MSYLGDTPFRMPDSWYDPPEPEVWTCTVCGHHGNEGDECEECEASFDTAALDPEDAYLDYLSEKADAEREERLFLDSGFDY